MSDKWIMAFIVFMLPGLLNLIIIGTTSLLIRLGYVTHRGNHGPLIGEGIVSSLLALSLPIWSLLCLVATGFKIFDDGTLNIKLSLRDWR